MSESQLDPEVFARGIGVLADRAGRELKAPTIRELYLIAREVLTTEEFTLAVRLHLKRSVFLPSVDELVNLVRPETDLKTEGQRAFAATFAALTTKTRTGPDGGSWTAVEWVNVAEAGFDPTAARQATEAIGGVAVLRDSPAVERPWLAHRWSEVYAQVRCVEQLRADRELLCLSLHQSPLLAGVPARPLLPAGGTEDA